MNMVLMLRSCFHFTQYSQIWPNKLFINIRLENYYQMYLTMDNLKRLMSWFYILQTTRAVLPTFPYWARLDPQCPQFWWHSEPCSGWWSALADLVYPGLVTAPGWRTATATSRGILPVAAHNPWWVVNFLVEGLSNNSVLQNVVYISLDPLLTHTH